MIIATFDLNGSWNFEGVPSEDFGICFVDGDAERAYPLNLSFGYDIQVNNETVDTHVWPPENISIRELSRTRVFSYRVEAEPDDEIVLSVWAENNNVMTKGKTEWVCPQPQKPYPSWSWVDGVWVAPKPHPGDGDYDWDEEALNWVPMEKQND